MNSEAKVVLLVVFPMVDGKERVEALGCDALDDAYDTIEFILAYADGHDLAHPSFGLVVA